MGHTHKQSRNKAASAEVSDGTQASDPSPIVNEKVGSAYKLLTANPLNVS